METCQTLYNYDRDINWFYLFFFFHLHGEVQVNHFLLLVDMDMI